MKLIVNKEEVTTKSDRINTLLEELQIVQDGIAVAVNKYVISKQNWSAYQLKENDNITIITATQGG